MPRYEFQCLKCENIEERVFSVTECPEEILCSACDHISRKIISKSSIRTDSPTWLDNSVRAALQDSERLEKGLDKPIETRTELNAHLKKHNLVATG